MEAGSGDHPKFNPVVPAALSPGTGRSKYEADHLHHSAGEIKNAWSYIPSPYACSWLCCSVVCCRVTRFLQNGITARLSLKIFCEIWCCTSTELCACGLVFFSIPTPSASSDKFRLSSQMYKSTKLQGVIHVPVLSESVNSAWFKISAATWLSSRV